MKRIRRAAAILAVWLLTIAAMPMTVSAAYENTHVNTGNQPADLVAVAKTQLGYVEGANDYSKYGAAYNMPNAPWCGFFVSWCARQAGIPKAVIPDSGSAGAFFSAGTYHARTSGYQPTTGDLIIYGTYGDADHVGIVERFDAATGRVYVLDGNWSDKVSSHYSPLTDTSVAGFVTPYYTSTASEMGVFNMVVPTVIPLGGVFSVSGFVASPNVIKTVNVTVADENGATCFSLDAAPNDKTFELAAFDEGLRFNELKKGLYSYIVTATDTENTRRWSYLFEVVGEIDYALTDPVFPTVLREGDVFCVYGTVTCSEALRSVSVEVYDAAGKFYTGGTLTASGTSFDVHALDDYLAFNNLKKGAYTLRVTARSANGSRQWDTPFTVGDTTKAGFVFRGALFDTVLKKGQAVTLDGTVTSSHRIATLTATVTDASGKTVLTSSVSPAQRVVSLETLTVATETLGGGDYVLTLTASGACGRATHTHAFTVETPVAVTLSGETAPTALPLGGVFSVRGTLTATEPLTKVELSVLAQDGSVPIRVTAAPQTTTYDLHRLDNDVTFNTLKTGRYVYRIAASTVSSQQQWEFPFTVGNVAPLPSGDLDGNGTVNMLDALALYSAAAGRRPMDAAQQAQADVNGDGKMNMLDAMQLFKTASGR